MFTPGLRLGPYEVLAPLGAGGMGEVWKARDTRVGRDVAVKVLPDDLVGDPGRLSRLEREARLLAALNHPGIASLLGFERVDGAPLLVLELVEGPTLGERLRRGRLSSKDALDIARQLAEALEAAHEKGIVHRDLKPSNIKLGLDGRVKLLDFGLAKALAGDDGSSVSTKRSTDTSPTNPGVVLGTAPYMSPEQARGESVDERTDVWAFGCVLFEMLSGKRAFAGPTSSDVIAAILDREPDWKAVAAETPPVRSLLRRCLTKDRARRVHAIVDARIEVEEALAPPELETGLGSRRSSSRRLVVAAALAVLLAAAGLTAWLRRPTAPTSHHDTRYSIAVTHGVDLPSFTGVRSIAMSPDGRRIVYQVEGGGLYIRSLDRVEAHLLTGSEHGSQPFFSPDGQWIGFEAGGKLQKISVGGGTPRLIAAASEMRGASWSEDGTIVYSPEPVAGLFRVSAEGGTPQKLTQPDTASESSHRWPQVLPGGKAVLFTIFPNSGEIDDARVAVLSTDSGARKVLVTGGTYGTYVPTGHLVFGSRGTLFAAPFDLRRLELTGPAVPVLENVRMASGGHLSAQYDFSPNGVLTYITPCPPPAETQLLWIDRKGSMVPLSPTHRGFYDLSLSPDGRRVVVSVEEKSATDLWVYDRDRETWTQLTAGKFNGWPIWSPGGDRVVFASNREGPQNLFVVPADGGRATRLTDATRWQYPTGWSPNGTSVFFSERRSGDGEQLFELPLDGVVQARPLVPAQASQCCGRVSPDGRWLAYGKQTATGRYAIYVRPYHGPGRDWTISKVDGGQPRWNAAGTELYYYTGDPGYKIWAVPVTTGPTFRAGAARVLFERTRDLYGFDVTPDGQHFVVAEDVSPEPERTQIVIVPDWFEELKTKVQGPR